MHGLKISVGIPLLVLSSLAPHAVGGTIADQKIRFFYESRELN